MKKITLMLLLSLIALSLSAQTVVRDELSKVDLDSVEFVNYEGPHAKFETAEQIRNIGRTLGNGISSGLASADYFSRYAVIHAVDPEGEGHFNADIFIIRQDAVVDHIKNVQRIIAGYLETAYSYSAEDADVLAEFTCYYNAVYRGNNTYFSDTYNEIVLNSLNMEKAGISTRYTEWPGNTEMLIPLTATGELKVSTDTVADQEVIEDLRTRDDKGIEPRKDVVELKEKEIEADQEKLDEDIQAVKEEEQALDKEKAALEEKKDELTDQQVEEKEQEITAKEEALDQKKEELAQQTEDLQDRQEAVQKEREQIAEDEAGIIARTQTGTAVSDENAEMFPFLVVDGNDPDLKGRLVLVNSSTGEISKRSSINTVRGRRFYITNGKLLAVTGIDKAPQAVRFMLLDPETLEVLDQGEDDIFSETDVVFSGSGLFAVTRIDGKWHLGKFDQDLSLTGQSEAEILPYSGIMISGKTVYVQESGGEIVSLDAGTLEKKTE